MYWHEGSYTWPPLAPPYQPNIDGTTTTTESNNTATGVVAPTPQIVSRDHLTPKELKRRADLLADEWAEEVMEGSVKCRACGKTIQLNHRNEAKYYPTNWVRHRDGRCPNIDQALSKVINSFVRLDPEHDLMLTMSIRL
jgi:hypothetical protein